MKTLQNLFLVGPMGSGKSAVGRALANALQRDFFDSDDEIEARTGVDIPFIFEKEGEPGFRLRESRMIEELTARQGIVLATGGGAIVDPANRQHLGARGFVVYLETSVDQQLKRTRRGRERPLLSREESDNRRAVLEALMVDRAGKYESIADLTVKTDGRKVRAVTEEILERLP